MTGKIEFSGDCFGFTGELFTVDKPEGWDDMTETEKGEWARDRFFEEFDWYWREL